MSHKTGNAFWGPAVWHTIHSFAASYTPDKKEHFKRFIYELQYLLPCEACRKHLKENLKKLSLEDYLDNNHNLFLWSYFLHDIVNRQLGKISPSYEDVKAYYYKGLGSECKQCILK